MNRSVGPILIGLMALACTAWAQNPSGKEIFEEGTHVCPSQDGATNWFSPSYNPSTGDDILVFGLLE
jgi:hypothetical protein